MPYPRTSQSLGRILRLIAKLYRFEPVILSQVATEFDVSERTIRRDLKKITEVIPLKQERGIWQLDTTAKQRGLLGRVVLQAFAENMRIKSSCLDSRSTDPRLVAFAIRYHRLPRKPGEAILQAILENRQISFDYTDKSGQHSHRTVDPVRLLHAQGFWYLICYDHNRQSQRNFRLDHISRLRILPDSRSLSPKQLQRIEATVDPWQSADTPVTEVLIYAEPYAANYLQDNPLLPSQSLLSAHEDGGMTFHYQITHPMELLPKIKSWIPYLHIEEPIELREKLHKELEKYCSQER
jgi:predicted DNA-binding transcriptional regulator YafY